MKIFSVRSAALGAALVLAPLVSAQAQSWTQWNSFDAGNVFGTLNGVAVTYTGARQGEQLFNGTGSMGNTNYFSPNGAYTQSGLTTPPLGFVQLNRAVTNVTITFAQAVINPYMSFISVGQGGLPVSYTFGAGTPAINVLSENNNPNCAFWGCGDLNVSGNTVTGVEGSGTVRINGTVSSLTFSTNTAEFWHGFTVGADRVAPSSVPEPASFALMGLGLAGLGVAARRRA